MSAVEIRYAATQIDPCTGPSLRLRVFVGEQVAGILWLNQSGTATFKPISRDGYVGIPDPLYGLPEKAFETCAAHVLDWLEWK